MCAPEYFGVEYSINPWMDVERPVDADRASEQWQELKRTLIDAGATVEVMAGQPGLPDLVFTANAGLVDRRQFVVANFRHNERQGERPHTAQWFADNGFDVGVLPPRFVQEGAGDALPFGDSLIAGYGPRSRKDSYSYLQARYGLDVVAVELTDPRRYHLDIAFCPIDDETALVAPGALTGAGARTLRRIVANPIELDESVALRFAANSVVVGDVVVMPYVPPAVGRSLARRGYQAVEVPMSEFMLAGGACRCLTLALDVELGTTKPLVNAA